MASHTFLITGDVNVEITITELADGSLRFDVTVLDTTGQIGDLRGLFFDLADDTLTSGISVSGADITDEVYKIDGVSSTGGSNNVKGEVLNEYGKFDFGIEIGTQGISTDDIQFTSFTVAHDTETLSIADFELQDMAVRLMSVGESGGARNGSLKLGGEIPEAPPEILANDDVLTVWESETAGDLEFLDGGADSVLANDTTDGAAYGGSVTGVNGDSGNIAQVVAGSSGGYATIYADGRIDFDAADEFDFLNDGESATTSFTYEVDGGATATVTVNVLGESDAPPPPPAGQTINLAIMLNSTQSMYALSQAAGFGIDPYADANGDGQDNQLMDMAYLMLGDFATDAFTQAAAANVTLNLSFISFGAVSAGEGSSYFTATDLASFDAARDAKVTSDLAGTHGQGFANAHAWFDSVAGVGDTNALFVISDGFSGDPWASNHAALTSAHGVHIDSFMPDVNFGSPALTAMDAMDHDGAADQIFTGDAALAASLGYVAYPDALSLDHLIV